MTITLITRADEGLGLETGRRLIPEGHDIWLAARDLERGRAASQPVGGWFVALDVVINDAGRTPSYG